MRTEFLQVSSRCLCGCHIEQFLNHGDTENTEIAQRRSPKFFGALVAVVLLLSASAVAQQKNPAGRNHPEVRQLSVDQQDALELMKTLAQDLKSESDNLSAAVLQAKLADVLWEFDDRFAREAFRWAFEAARKSPSEKLSKAEGVGYVARQAATIREVLTLTGKHDQKRSDAWLKTIEDEKTQPGRSVEEGNFRSDLLLQIALQLVESNPAQAKQLGILAVNSGQIPEDFGRLLFALSRVSRSQSDELFRAALATLRRNDFMFDTALIVLINYLFSPGGVLDSDATVADAQLLANYLVDAAWRQARGAPNSGLPESSASFYSLVDVRGGPIVSRYAPERLPELQGQMLSLASRLSQPQLENAARMRASQQQQRSVLNSDDKNIDERIERATNEKDPQVRDALLNGIAHSLMRTNNEKALEVAAKIDDAETRAQAEDDIRLVAIQRLLHSRAYQEVKNTSLKLKNRGLQAKMLVELASRVLRENDDTVTATELLSEAYEIVMKDERVPDKVLGMLLIAQQFVRFDTIRGFETLGNTIKTLNQYKGDEKTESVLSKPRLLKIKSYTVINGSEVSSSDRATFDSIDFSQVEPFVLHDYLQTKLLANKIEQPLPRAKFLTAVTTAILLKTKEPTKTLEQ